VRKRGAYRLFELEKWAYSCVAKGLDTRNPSLMRHAAQFIDLLQPIQAGLMPEVTPFAS
jgi:hypothetical protein